MARIEPDPLMNALTQAGIADANTRRVVVDIQLGHLPIVHIERHGDEQLLTVALALDGVEIKREEAPTVNVRKLSHHRTVTAEEAADAQPAPDISW